MRSDEVARAHEHLRSALSRWNPADLSACDQVCVSIEMAIAEMEAVEKNAARFDPSAAPRLIAFRNDVAHLARLVEAAQSYNRGISRFAESAVAGAPAAVEA